jgi:hypothetical protein
MGWQADTAGGTGKTPRGRWLPSARDLELAGLTRAGGWDQVPTSAGLAVALETAAGDDGSYPGVDRHAELTALLGRWQALESWAAAGKLGVLRTLIGAEQYPFPDGAVPARLPQEWSKSLTHEVALVLGMAPVTADRLMWTAWDLGVRLPGVGQRLADGKLTLPKARAINDALAPLSEEDVILAEELVLDRLSIDPSMTYGQVEKAAAQAAVLLDPDAAVRRRQGAEEEYARVSMFRESSGAAGLSGRDLPVDQTLTAAARLADRAQEYKDSGAFPQARMDWLRAVAFLDLLNDITAEDRIGFARAAAGQPGDDPGPGDPGLDDDPDDDGPDDLGPDDLGPDDPGPDDGDGGPADGGPDAPGPADGGEPSGCGDVTGPGTGAPGCPCRQCDGSCNPPDDDDSDPGPGNDLDDVAPAGHAGTGDSAADPAGTGPAPDQTGPDVTGPAGAPGDDGPAGPQPEIPSAFRRPAPRLTDLVVPLVTLFGWEARPGESHGLGILDPGLCRTLAALAAASPQTQLCVTVTTDDGIAIGHGCARPARKPPANQSGGTDRAGTTDPPATLPARLNLTITASLLAGLSAAPRTASPPSGPGWSLTRDHDPGPPGGYGTWTLTLPDGRKLTIALEPVPTFDCDHRHETHAYQPNEKLRHLVQIRDRTCTLPVCNRHARECDFEHATPYDQGGRTCSCNAGARSRACHQVKQAKGWTVTQPLPGWHQWQTPSGQIYTQAPYQYPT